MPANEVRGRFLWLELLTTDPKAAIGFYTDFTGWTAEDWDAAGRPYTMWMNGETPVGGVMTLPDEAKKAGAPPHWLAYVGTPDVDALIEQAKELDGKLLSGPHQIQTVGRFAILSDPQGAVFAVLEPETEPEGPVGSPQVGEFSWHELATTDHEGALEFYRALFGWEPVESMDMGEAGIYQMYGWKDDGVMLGGMYNKTAEMPGPPAWLYYIKVEDANAAVGRVEELGGRVLNGPMEVPGGDLVAQCMDPQGAAFAVHSSGAGA